jgi:hypothetical protein
MSIYCSLAAPDDEHPDDCAIWVEVDDSYLEANGVCDCELRTAPIIYHGSHIFPSDQLERGGYIDVAYIPSHCGPHGTYLEEGEAPHPFLRFGVNEGTVILEPSHVSVLVECLSGWLDAVAERERA